MIKNLKKITLSIFVFIFSLAYTVSISTIASAPVFSSGVSDYEDDVDDYRNDGIYDDEDAYFFDIQSKILDELSAKKNRKTRRSPRCPDHLLTDKLYSLCKQIKKDENEIPANPIAQYSLVCKNFYKLSSSKRKYKYVRQVLENTALRFFEKSLKANLIFENSSEETTFKILYGGIYNLDKFSSKTNTFSKIDAIFLYSCIKTFPQAIPDLAYMENLLILNDINPETLF